MKGEISMKKTKWKKLIATFVMLVLMFQLTTNVGNASNEVKYNRKQLQDIYLDNLMRAVKKSDKLDESKYKIRIVDNQTAKYPEKHWIKCNSTQDVVKYLENNEKHMKETKNFVISDTETYENIDNTRAAAKKKTKSVTKSYSRGLTPKYTLKATFKYDTRTKKIKSVTKRKFSLSGLTLAIGAEDKTFSTKYSSTKKTATVKCSYTEVSYLVLPIGRIEILRKDAYQKFSYSVSKGVTGGEGGYE